MAIRGSADVAFFLLGGYDILGTITQIDDRAEALLEETHALGDAWREQSFVGVRQSEISQDGFYDDVMDSVRYAGENFLRGALRDESYLAGRVKRQLPVEIRAVEPWRWMVDGPGSSALTRLTEWG